MLITAGFSLFVLAHLCLKVYLAASPKVLISFVLALLFALVQVTLYEEGSLRDCERVDVISFCWKNYSFRFFSSNDASCSPFFVRNKTFRFQYWGSASVLIKERPGDPSCFVGPSHFNIRQQLASLRPVTSCRTCCLHLPTLAT